MRTKYKLFCVILLVSIILGVSTSIYAYNDLKQDSVYNHAIDVLSSIGVFEGNPDNTFKPDGFLKRSEMAVILTRILTTVDIADKTQDVSFYDVFEDDWAAPYIKVVTDYGIMYGNDEGFFKPDEPLTYYQAVESIVSLLGYREAALNNGGYPFGFLKYATELKLTNKIVLNGENPISRAEVAQLIYNSLEVDVLIGTRIGQKSIYNSKKGDNILSLFLRLHRSTGIVKANSNTMLAREGKLNKGKVEINGEIFETGTTAAESLLGYSVEYYFKNTDSGDKLIKAIFIRDENVVHEISAEDISSYSNNKLTYQIDEHNTSIMVSDTADVVFNGKYIFKPQPEDFMPETGGLKLIDNDGDGISDVVFITSYVTYVIDSVGNNTATITDKYLQRRLVLDGSENKISFAIRDGNNKVSVSDLKEWDVLTIAADKIQTVGDILLIDTAASTLYDIQLTRKIVSGTVTEVSEDKVTIDGKQYTIAKSYKAAINSNLAMEITPLTEGTFVLNYLGQISGNKINTLPVAGKYGFAINAVKSTGIDNTVEIKIFTQSGKWESIKCAEKVTLNGTPKSGADDIFKAFKTDKGNKLGDSIVPQLIVYKQNQEGLINFIDTIIYDDSKEDATGSLKFDNDINNGMFKQTNKTMAGKIVLDDGVLIFNVPCSDLAKKIVDISKEDEFEIATTGIFINDSYYYVDAYNTSDAGVTKVVVNYNPIGKLSANHEIVLVDKIISIYEDGQTLYKLTGYKNGVAFTGICKESVIFWDSISDKTITPADIKRGDIVRFADSMGRINRIERIFTMRTSNNSLTPLSFTIYEDGTNNGYFKQFKAVLGKVYRREGTVIRVGFTEKLTDTADFVVYNLKDLNLFIYDEEHDIIKPATLNDIGDFRDGDENWASRIFIYARYGDDKAAVIYKPTGLGT